MLVHEEDGQKRVQFDLKGDLLSLFGQGRPPQNVRWRNNLQS